MSKVRFPVSSFLALGALLSIGGGCSSSIFTGDKSNDYKPSQGNAEVSNLNCQGLDLSNEALNVPTFRGLIRCLNSNHSIREYQAFVDRASDEQLQGFLDVMNRELVLDKPRLAALDKSIQQFDNQEKRLDVALMQLGRALSKPKFATSLLRVFRQGATVEGRMSRDVLTSIRLLTEELAKKKGGRENLRRILDVALDGLVQESYRGMVQGFRLPIPVGRPALKVLSRQALQYAQEKIKLNQPLTKMLLWGLADGSAFRVLDRYYYGGVQFRKSPLRKPELFDRQVQDLEQLIRYLTIEHKEDVFQSLVRLFGVMNESISCMEDTKEIPNGDLFVMNELLKMDSSRAPFWTMRTNMLKLKLASSMCAYPAEFNDLMRVLATMARDESTPMVTVANIVKALKAGDDLPMDQAAHQLLQGAMVASKKGKLVPYPANERFRRVMIELLADKGSANVYTHLADVFAELAREDRGVLAHFFYFTDFENRDDIGDLARTLVRSRADLRKDGTVENRSIYDVLVEMLLRVDADVFTELVTSAAEYLDSNDDYLAPFLAMGRETLLFNDVNPILDMALSIGKAAELNAPFFKALLELSETKEFENAIALTATMAQNGQLKDMLKGILTILLGTQTQAIKEPKVLPVPTLKRAKSKLSRFADVPAARKSWDGKHRAYWPTDRAALDICAELDLELGFASTGDPRWALELTKTGKCVNAEGNYEELIAFLNYAMDKGYPVKDGKPFSRFLMDMSVDLVHVRDTAVKRRLLDEIGDILVDPPSFHDLIDLQTGLRFLFDEKFGHRDERISVVQAVSRFFSIIPTIAGKVQELFRVLATVVEDERFPTTLALLYDLQGDAEKARPPVEHERPALSTEAIGELKTAIRRYEAPDESQIQDLVKLKSWEYWNQLQSWDQRYDYKNESEFKAALKPMLDQLANPRNSLLEHALTFFYKLDSDPYDSKWLQGWLQRLAAEVHPIPYYYPGTYPGGSKPTVRFVSQLDLLELIVIDADFSLEELGQKNAWMMGEKADENFAIKYLTKLAESGNNLQEWIDELDAKLTKYYSAAFPPDAESDDSVLKKAGRLLGNRMMVPELKRRMFNLRQVSVVVSQLVKNEQIVQRSQVPGGPKRKLVRNDLGILRDLFYAVLSATPEQDRHVYRKDRNSLGFIVELVRFGALRSIGTNMWYRGITKNEAVPIDFIFDLISQAISIKDGSQHRLNQDTLAVFDFLLRKNSKNLASGEFDDRYILLGQIISKIYEWTKSDHRGVRDPEHAPPKVMTKVKRSLYYLAQLISDMDLATLRSKPDVPAKIVQILRPFLGTDRGARLVGKNLDLLEPVLTSDSAVNFLEMLLQASAHDFYRRDRLYSEDKAFLDFLDVSNLIIQEFYEDNSQLAGTGLDVLVTLYEDPKSRLEAAGKAWDAMKSSSNYQSYKKRTLDRVTGQLMRWFINQKRERALPRRLQNYVADHLRRGDALALVSWIGNQSTQKSDLFYRNTRFLGDQKYILGIQDFLESIKSGIVDTRINLAN